MNLTLCDRLLFCLPNQYVAVYVLLDVVDLNPNPSAGIKGMESLGAKIKSRCLANALIQAQLAAKIGVSDALIGHWETGLYPPPPERVAMLEKVFGPLSGGRPSLSRP